MLAGYEKLRSDFDEVGAAIVAGTVDAEDKTLEVAADLGFPVAYGMTRADGDRIGAFWEERRDHIQPSEFILRQRGRVVSSTYSSSPVGRMDPAETLSLLRFLDDARRRKESGSG